MHGRYKTNRTKWNNKLKQKIKRYNKKRKKKKTETFSATGILLLTI